MNMTKADFLAVIEKYGPNLCGINLDNGRIIYIGYEDTPTLEDITIETIGAMDFLKVTRHGVQPQGSQPIDMVTLHPLDLIQCFQISSSPEIMIDPKIMN